MLEQWVQDEKILMPGEQLVFTLQVVAQPTVVELSGAEDCLLMNPKQFFAVDRMMALGVPQRVASRIRHVFFGYSRDNGLFSHHPTTMAIFVKENPVEYLGRINKLGKTSVGYIKMLLSSAGLVPNT
jgi:hypothetical protein